jgi:competence protein ComEC
MLRASVLFALAALSVILYLPAGLSAGGQSASLSAFGGACPHGTLCVFYLDIGQGDAELIQSPTGAQVLIDGGPDDAVLSQLARVMGYFDRRLDLVMPTHPDADHVGGLVDVFARYEVGAIVRTENESDTATWHALTAAMGSEGAPVTYARRGQQYDLGGGATLAILYPDRDASAMDSNDSSIVARLTYGGTSFLFTGDSPISVERYLIAQGTELKSDVLKVGHHGSRTSTSDAYVAAVAPTYAIISVGADNRYGHPHREVLDTLQKYGVLVHRTDEEGTIEIDSDGKTVTVQ